MPSPNQQPSHQAWHPKGDVVAAVQAGQQVQALRLVYWLRFDQASSLDEPLHVG